MRFPRPLRSFLTFCSGADYDALEKSQDHEQKKHRNIGVIILLTAIFASLSGGYALSTVFDYSTLSIRIPLKIFERTQSTPSDKAAGIPNADSSGSELIDKELRVVSDSLQQRVEGDHSAQTANSDSLQQRVEGKTRNSMANSNEDEEEYLVISLPFAMNLPAIGFGLLWGVMIFALDRYLVTSIKKKIPEQPKGPIDDNKGDSNSDKFKYPDYLPDRREFLQALPRLFLATVIAVVISKPLELKIFEKEIEIKLAEKRNQLKLGDQEQVGAIYRSDRLQLQSEVDRLRAQVREKEIEVKEYYESYKAEIEGSGGTGKVGIGPIAKEKLRKYNQSDAEFQELRASNDKEISVLNEQISNIDSLYQIDVERRREGSENYDGLLARIEALDQMQNPWPSIFIMLLFLSIETAPILAKLLSPAGTYELVLKELEENHIELLKSNTKYEEDKEVLMTDTTKKQSLRNEQLFLEREQAKTLMNESDYKEKVRKKQYRKLHYGNNSFVQVWNRLKELLFSRIFEYPQAESTGNSPESEQSTD